LVTIRERLQACSRQAKRKTTAANWSNSSLPRTTWKQDYLEEEASEAEKTRTPLHACGSRKNGKPGAAKDAQAVRAAITAEIAELTAFIDAAKR
jgi:hypothetical protein